MNVLLAITAEANFIITIHRFPAHTARTHDNNAVGFVLQISLIRVHRQISLPITNMRRGKTASESQNHGLIVNLDLFDKMNGMTDAAIADMNASLSLISVALA